MIYELRFSIRHDEDWTVLTEEFDIKMRTVSYFTRRAGGRIVDVEVFNIGCSHQLDHCESDLRGFINGVKRFRNVLRVSVLNYSRRFSTVLTIEDYDSSIRKIINDNMGFFVSTTSRDGVEEYVVIFPLGSKHMFSGLRRQLSSIGTIKYFHFMERKEPILTGPQLTNRELDAIKLAWQKGFFEYPKGTTLDEMAEILHIRKQTLNFYLRNALRKSIEFLLKNNFYDY